jgi:hypothetical protein
MLVWFSSKFPGPYIWATGVPYFACSILTALLALAWGLSIALVGGAAGTILWTWVRAKVGVKAHRQGLENAARQGSRYGVTRYRQCQEPSPRQGLTSVRERAVGD